MIYELSHDYKRAWQLIQQGEKLACWVDRLPSRVVGEAYLWNDRVAIINAKSVNHAWLADEENTLDLFVERCTELNTEFYLPLADDMLAISKERLQEIASNVVSKSLEKFDDLIETMGKIAS